MRALVTGGAGYVGTELVRALAAHPSVDEVIVYDNLSRKNHNLFLQPALPATPAPAAGRDTFSMAAFRR